MLGKRWTLLRLFGFEIRFDLTWLILLALIVWTLSEGYFPAEYRDLPEGTYLWMGVLGAIGLIASIVIHELSHSLVARSYGLRISGITLFAFGGAAEMTEEPPTPRAEFMISIVGPLTSLVLAAIFFAVGAALDAADVPRPYVGVVNYLAGINVILALFNLVPAFPLDGGRVLRAVLWGWRGDVRWATRVAASIGGGFGFGLMLLGIFNVLTGNIVGGLWSFLIGMFVRAAAAGHYQQLVAREVLGGIPITSVMTRDLVTVSPNTAIADLVDNYFLGRNLKLVPVIVDGRVLGVVDVRAAKAVPREEWDRRRVAEVMTPLSPENTIGADADAHAALEQMQRTGQGRLLVMDHGRLVGIVSLKDMLRMLSLRMDLESAPPAGGRPGDVPPGRRFGRA
jgi:Zn-dependent protease/predicted transcriptional regulator